GLWSTSGANPLLDPGVGPPADALPVRQGAVEDVAADAAKQAAGNLVDELLPLSVVPHFPHHHAGLTEIVILRIQRIGTSHHLAVRFPAVGYGAGLVGPASAAAVGGVDRRIAAVVVRHLSVEHIGLYRHLRLVHRQLMEIGADAVALRIV